HTSSRRSGAFAQPVHGTRRQSTRRVRSVYGRRVAALGAADQTLESQRKLIPKGAVASQEAYPRRPAGLQLMARMNVSILVAVSLISLSGSEPATVPAPA